MKMNMHYFLHCCFFICLINVNSIAFQVVKADREKWLAVDSEGDHYRRPGPIRFTGKSEEERPITLELNALADQGECQVSGRWPLTSGARGQRSENRKQRTDKVVTHFFIVSVCHLSSDLCTLKRGA